MSYTQLSKENEANRQKARELDNLAQEMKQRQAIDAGRAEGQNQLLMEIQAMADREARMNNAPLSTSEYAVNARQGREVQGPSLYDQVKGYLGGMFSSDQPAQQSPQVSAFAERERLAEQQRLDRIAQEAERAQAAREYQERGNY
jgi:hypothetical protein